jgi:isoquinoline 1-oxidoreductase beta subunit
MLVAMGGLSPAGCQAQNGFVKDVNSRRQLSCGQLVEKASRLTIPTSITLKERTAFRLIGQPTRRLDTPDKTNGKAMFGIDIKVSGMLTAVVARSPVLGGKVKSFDAEKAKRLPGVKAIVEIGSGIAVVADGFWPATRGRDALHITWDEGPLSGFESGTQRKQYFEVTKTPGAVARKEGDVSYALTRAVKKVEANYEVPYLATATMEPLNCVADLRSDHCELWVGTQFQSLDRDAVARMTGLKPEQVELHTTFAGGGFGRRGSPDADFVLEAVQISKLIRAPVKVIWTREDDMRGGYYRPAYCDSLVGALDVDGRPIVWTHRIVGQSVLMGTPFEKFIESEGDVDSVEGATNLPYEIPNILVDVHTPRTGPRVWAWRSVGSSHNAFVVEGFCDELAHAAGKDPFEFRRALLSKHQRHRAVLEPVAEKAGWDKKLPSGRALGIAMHEFSSIVAQVAEVSVSNEGIVRVHRVVCAIDCGTVVNPDTVRAQMEGGIVFGLSAALFGEITFKGGRVQQGNFHDYPVLRMDAMPKIEVHILPSSAPPLGVGEAGVPPIAPALANGVFAVTAKRIRQLPIRPDLLNGA